MDRKTQQSPAATRHGSVRTDDTSESIIQPIESIPDPTIEPDQPETMKFNARIIIGVYVFVISLGVCTGYVLSKNSTLANVGSSSKTAVTATDTSVGSSDTATFKDSATGIIEKGGLNGEGTHKLIREGGPSQTAYLLSSIVDLDEFVGKKVKIWGQTMTAKKVSWLMDVGKIEMISE